MVDTQGASEDIDGSILSIVVENLLCHEKCEINFNRNVNFVVGRNGSGKSAFVTALVVGLGGKAAATNRGTNLTCFIKKGAESASVEVKIKNSSPMAYKHNTYGDSITIIHSFNISGGSTYKIKSDAGKVISTKFQDVQDITVAHNIQVDNPISVLNQDEARSFLSNDSKKKYAFFRKATNFDETERNYTLALNTCKQAENMREAKMEAFKSQEAEYNRWRKLKERMESQVEVEKKKKELENEYFWSEVTALETKAEGAREVDRRRAEMAEQLTARRDALVADATPDLDAVVAQLAQAKAEQRALEARREAAEAAQREAAVEARRREQAVRRLREDRARELRKLDALRQAIQDMEAGAGVSARAELEAAAERCAAAEAAARARHATALHEAQQARGHEARARDLLEAADDRLRRQNEQIERAWEQARSLEAAGGDSLAAYGQQVADLCRRVDAAAARGAFSQKPRGPVGAFIKLLDQRWGSAMEHIIGNNITTFCVNNDQDSRTLFKIINEVYADGGNKPIVCSSRFEGARHDVSRRAARAPGHVAALDAVAVPDAVVANFLVDNLSLETVLLVPDDDTAMGLTDTAANVPRNLRRVVTADCAEFFPAPNYRSYGGSARPVSYLHRDEADRLREARSALSAARAQGSSLEAARAAAAEEARRAGEALRADERALRPLAAALGAAEDALRAARDALQAHHAPTHHALEEELRTSEERLEEFTAKLAEAEAAAAAGAGGAPEEDVGAALRQAKARCRDLSTRVEEEKMSVERARSDRAAVSRRLAELQAERERARAQIDALAQDADGKREEALKLCPRIQNPRRLDVVREELCATRAKMRAGAGTELSPADVAERLLGARTRYRRTRRALDRVGTLIGQIKSVVDHHLLQCYQLQTNIVRNAQHTFECTLSMRGYTGMLEVNKARGELSVSCGAKGRGVGGAASLSGGERSYATVAFFMALWDCVDLPFIFLDEFDVFMDPVNRKAVMDMLISHAAEHRACQFVFLTPQDGNALEGSQAVSIFRLNNPRA